MSESNEFVKCNDHLHVIYLCEYCNLNCTYCYEDGKSRKKIDFETAKNIVDEIMEMVDNEVTARIMLFGGEPLLNYEVFYAITEYAYNEYFLKGRNIMFNTITNGTLLNERKVKELFKFHDFLSIHVSIDGDQEAHDACRVFHNGRGSYDIVIKNVKFLLKYFPFAVIRLVITDVDKFYNNVKFLRSIGVRTFTIQALKGDTPSTPYYIKRYYEVIKQLEEEFSHLNRVEINEYSEPITDVEAYSTRKKEEALKTDEEYRYFGTDGGKIFKPTYFEGEFQDFTKGTDASYNANKKSREEAIGVKN